MTPDPFQEPTHVCIIINLDLPFRSELTYPKTGVVAMSNEFSTSNLFRTSSRKNDTTWQVIQDGKEIGPLTQDALVEMAETGQIERDDLVREAGGEWIKASEATILRRQFSDAEPNEIERAPSDMLLANIVRYQTHLAFAFLALVLVIGVAMGFYLNISAPPTVAGTTWQGSEDLEKFGYLKFDFRSDGTAIMTDAAFRKKGNVHGKWSQSGSDVTIRFTNCRYDGTIQKSNLKGTATYVGQSGHPWSFSVSKQ